VEALNGFIGAGIVIDLLDIFRPARQYVRGALDAVHGANNNDYDIERIVLEILETVKARSK